MDDKTHAIMRGVTPTLTSYSLLTQLMRDGLVPTNADGEPYRVFLQRLVAFASDRDVSAECIVYCSLEWLTAYKPQEKERIAQVVQKLLEQGEAYTVDGAARVVGYGSRTVRNWISKGFLPGVLVFLGKSKRELRRGYIVPSDDLMRKAEIIARYTAYEAAAMLGLTPGAIHRRARSGRLKGANTPDGWRFTGDDISAFKTSSQHPEGFTFGEVRRLLDVPEVTLFHWLELRFIAVTVVEGVHLYSRNDVLRFKEERERIRGGFEWLPKIEGDRLLATKAVAKKLGANPKTVGIWTKKGLLPYYNPAPEQLQRHMLRQYPETYINGLLAFAQTNTQRPLIVAARLYKEQLRATFEPHR